MRPALLGRLYPYLSRDLRRGASFLNAFFGEGLTDLDDPLYSHRPRYRTSMRNLRFLRAEALAVAAEVGDPQERRSRGCRPASSASARWARRSTSRSPPSSTATCCTRRATAC